MCVIKCDVLQQIFVNDNDKWFFFCVPYQHLSDKNAGLLQLLTDEALTMNSVGYLTMQSNSGYIVILFEGTKFLSKGKPIRVCYDYCTLSLIGNNVFYFSTMTAGAVSSVHLPYSTLQGVEPSSGPWSTRNQTGRLTEFPQLQLFLLHLAYINFSICCLLHIFYEGLHWGHDIFWAWSP